MNIKAATITTVTLMVLISAAAISPVMAQNAGFQIGLGLGAPQNPLATPASPNPVQGMTTPPIQGMTTPPIMPMGGGIAQLQANGSPQIFTGGVSNGVSVLPPGGVIFVPAGTLVVESSPGMQQGAFLTAPVAPQGPNGLSTSGPPNGSRGRGAANQNSNRNTTNEQRNSTQQDASRLALGTPRDKVIEKYGNPIAFIMNMNGETLYFNGGVVVFVRDGVVATPGQ